MITFQPLRDWFDDKRWNRYFMCDDVGLSPTTVNKIWGDKGPVKTDVIDRICTAYDLSIEQVIRFEMDIDPQKNNEKDDGDNADT